MLEKPQPGKRLVINHKKYTLDEAEALNLVDVERDKDGNVTKCVVKQKVVPQNLLSSQTLADGSVIKQN